MTTSAAIVRTLFVNDLRRSLRGVSQIESVRITAEALVPELTVESSSLPVHYFNGSADYRTSLTISIL